MILRLEQVHLGRCLFCFAARGMDLLPEVVGRSNECLQTKRDVMAETPIEPLIISNIKAIALWDYTAQDVRIPPLHS